MAPQETQKLDDILEGLGELRSDFRVFKTKMLGDDVSENEGGRVPRLEEGHENHEKRITRIEGFVLMVLGAAGLLKGLAWGADSMRHVMEVLKR